MREEEAAAAAALVVLAVAVTEGVGSSLETRAGMVGDLDPPGRRRFQRGSDWRNLWSSCWLAALADGMLRFMGQRQQGRPIQGRTL